jgi:hypothetical protein
MERNKKLLFIVVYYGLIIFFWLNILSTFVTLLTLIRQACVSDSHMFSVPVTLHLGTIEHYYPTYVQNGASIHVSAHSGYLDILTDNPLADLKSILSFTFSRLLIIGIIYNLWKMFGTFYRNEPFQYENIKLLKRIALYIVLLPVLSIIDTIIDYIILRTYNNKLSLNWNLHVENMLCVAAIVYIIAEVLKYGFELKKENEEFI